MDYSCHGKVMGPVSRAAEAKSGQAAKKRVLFPSSRYKKLLLIWTDKLFVHYNIILLKRIQSSLHSFSWFLCVYFYPLFPAELPIWLSFENGVIRASDHHLVQTHFLLFFIFYPAENYKDKEWKYELLVKSLTATIN